MTVDNVKTAIEDALRVIDEWKQASQYLGDIDWREEHTRYAIIDPIIRALGWRTEDPKECHPEYPRSYNGGRVDYALFGNLDLQTLPGRRIPAPDIIIEAKSLATNFAEAHITQLQRYVNGPIRMMEGAAVLTNGIIWRIYKIQGSTTLRRAGCVEVDIQERDLRVAEELYAHLNRQRWPRQTHT